MLSVLKEAVQYGFVLPLIIRTSEDERVLHPDAAPGEMESRVNKRPAEVQPLGVGVEHIRRAAFLHMFRRGFECRQQECVEILVLEAVILNGQPVRTFEGDSVGRIGQQQVRSFAVHEQSDVFLVGRVTADETVLSDRPHVAALHEGSLLQSGGKGEAVILYIFITAVRKQVGKFRLVEAGQQRIKVRSLQSLDLYAQKLLVPSGVHCHAVVRDDVRFLLGFGEVVGEDARHLGNAFLLRGEDTAVSGDDAVIAVDDDGVYKTELPQRRPQFEDLLRGVRSCVIHIGNEFADRDEFHFRGCFHLISPHSANFSKPPTERI